MPDKIISQPELNSNELAGFFMQNSAFTDKKKIERLADIYISECLMEKVNSDIAFAQMCLETGFLSFGGLVTAEMNNFCGLGALNEENPGLAFPSEQSGVRAHIQHLKGYATAEPLVNECADPRFKYINPKGKAPFVKDLTGTWAADNKYGEKINAILRRMYLYKNKLKLKN